jgi:hypothetical protein
MAIIMYYYACFWEIVLIILISLGLILAVTCISQCIHWRLAIVLVLHCVLTTSNSYLFGIKY